MVFNSGQITKTSRTRPCENLETNNSSKDNLFQKILQSNIQMNKAPSPIPTIFK